MNHPPAYVTKRPSLLHTAELESVTSSCRKRVERIARDCRAENRKFRDIEFDLENDQHRCLYGLFNRPGENFAPSDVLRATKIFKNAEFFANGTPDSTQIVQGNIGNCWFLSALSSVATAPGLLEQICVARDERVGVYGFIFFRDNRWVDVIIDDLLCTRRPKFEDLSLFEQGLYLDDKDYYLKSASINEGKTLYFARSGTHNATWVPLIEKAYAKLHGHYGYLHLGKTCEAMEDLTGGVSKGIFTNDILDPDRFWTEELLRANKDRLFTCQIHEPNSNRVNQPEIKIQGLVTAHAYTVLRAVECRGKKFVVLRNPWGRIEWTGRWSDGSKEWTKEWIAVLDELGHSFGDDGQFIMEYSDWLECFTDIDRTLLFDTSWKMSSHWLGVACRPLPTPLSYGDVSFAFTLSTAASTVISLAQLDTKYFRDIASRSLYTLDFVVVKEGEEEPMTESQHTKFQARDVSVEAYLEAGTYIVYARFDRVIDPTVAVELSIEDWQLPRLSRVMTKRAEGRAIAFNSIHPYNKFHLQKPLKDLIQSAKRRHQRKQEQQRLNQRGDASETDTEYFTDDDESANHTETVTKKTTTVVVEKTRVKNPKSKLTTQPHPKPSIISVPSTTTTKPKKKRQEKYTSKHKSLPSPPRSNGHTREPRIGVGAPRVGPTPYITPWQPVPARNHNYHYTGPGPVNQWSRPTSPSPPEPPKDQLTSTKVLRDDENIIYLGLKVYTNTGGDGAEVEIVSRIGDVPSDDDRDDRSSARGRSISKARSRTRSRSVSRRRSRTSSSSRSPLRR